MYVSFCLIFYVVIFFVWMELNHTTKVPSYIRNPQAEKSMDYGLDVLNTVVHSKIQKNQSSLPFNRRALKVSQQSRDSTQGH